MEEVVSKPRGKMNPWLIVLIVVLVLAVIGVAAYFVIKSRPKTSDTAKTTTTSSSDRIIDEGVTWTTAQKLEDLGLLEKTGDESLFLSADYFKVGTTSTGAEIIVAQVKLDGPAFTFPIHRFLKQGDKYQFLTLNSDPIDTSNGYNTGVKVSYDNSNSVVFKSLSPDASITNGATELVKSDNLGIVSARTGEEKLTGESTENAKTKWGTLYLYKEKPEAEIKDFTVSYYYILLNDSTWAMYEAKPIALRDDNTLDVAWKKQGLDSVKYTKAAAGGCGFGAGAVPVMTSKTDLDNNHLVATDSKGGKYYGPKTADDSIAKLGYEEYKVGRNDNELVAMDKFISDTGTVIWVDDYGLAIIYQREEYMPQAECAKPVVYLYPTQTTSISVKVGAKITKSDPEYGNGWKVTADPSGKLTLGDGRIFDSLFWDGLGLGRYPAITTGKVIKTADARTVITNDLKYMGFNQKETSDFLEFWMPKMPTTPFTRITWLQNKEMDALAPLSVRPKPDTTIRAFLDYRGLNSPVEIAPQTLTKYHRTGFVATEWGGLLTK